MAKLALAASLGTIVLALMAMMGAFLGRGGPDLAALNRVLAAWVPIALVLAAVLYRQLGRTGDAPVRLWSRLPAWLYVLMGGLIILAALAELSLLLAVTLSDRAGATLALTPILALVASCICLAPAWASVFADDRPRRHDAPGA